LLAAKSVKKVRDILGQVKQHLFPSTLQFHTMPVKRNKLPKGNGGWGDKRDRALCNLLTLQGNSTTSDEDALLQEAADVESKRERRRGRKKIHPR